MKKIISPKITSFVFSILVLTFLAVFYAIAWTEPTQAPPGGNVSMPLNISNTGQSKEGGLILNTGGATNGLVVDRGNICLGTNCISSWSVVPSGMIAMFDAACPSGWTRFAALDNRFPQGAAIYGGTGGVSTHSHPFSGVTGSPNDSYGGTSGYWYPFNSSQTHTHNFLGDTSSVSNLPPYLNVIWCKKN